MKRRASLYVWAILLAGRAMVALSPAGAQTVRVAPVIRAQPTPLNHARQSGTNPPQSLTSVESGETFFVEFWATNSGDPLDGLACVHVDFASDRTDLVTAVEPHLDSAYFPISVVPVVFDNVKGTVGDLGGCQTAPPLDMLGVGEWVVVDRIEMLALSNAGTVTFTLADADNIFAGTAIIGQLTDVDPQAIEFLPNSLDVGSCTVFPYGDVTRDNQVDIFDIFCVLDGFVDFFDNCPFEAVDIAPCDGGDGQIDIFDIFAVLDSFIDTPPCDDPCIVPGR